jgi:hypothetical protein
LIIPEEPVNHQLSTGKTYDAGLQFPNNPPFGKYCMSPSFQRVTNRKKRRICWFLMREMGFRNGWSCRDPGAGYSNPVIIPLHFLRRSSSTINGVFHIPAGFWT